MPVPLDEFPVHQVPLSMAHVATSDRNAYDRYYFNAHDGTGDVMLVTGLGVYPNLGVKDAYVTVRRAERQVTLRLSDQLDDDRLHPRVGPYRVEVLEPLEQLHVACDAPDHGVAIDLTWTGSFPAADEPEHAFRPQRRRILDARRFAQVGTWSGTIRIDDDDEIPVTPDRWVGTRDRSWGIRPSGDPDPAGRDAQDPIEGFWWLYVPLRFPDYALLVIAQEEPDGTRVLDEAVRVWRDGANRRVEPLGRAETEIRYRPGTREVEGAVLHIGGPRRTVLSVEVEPLTFVALNCGPGYGGDPEWSHGLWRGPDWSERVDHDLDDPTVAARIPFGVVDYAARAVAEGAPGAGLFEHATFGRHDPSGFADWGSVAS